MIRMGTRKIFMFIIAFMLALTFFVPSIKVDAYGPSVMYTGTNPAPGYPRAIQLQYNGANNGKMLAVFDHNVATMPTFKVFESTDSGANWAQVGSVSDTQNGWGMRYQPHLYELPQAIGNMPAGTLLIAGNSIPSDYTATKIDIYKSNDLGRTWSFLSSVATGGDANPDSLHDPIWEPFLLVANNKLICYYSDERDPAYAQKLVHQTSTNGTSWGSVVNDVALTTQWYRPGMATIAKMANGKYIMTYEMAPLSGWPVHYQISSNPEVWDTANMGTYIGAGGGTPYVVTMPNGKIIVSMLEHPEIFVNSNNGTGSWTTLSTPMVDSYSRSMTPLANGRLFIITSNGNNIEYGDMDAGGTLAKFINRSTGKALDNTGSIVDGTDVAQWTNVASNNLVWEVQRGNDGYYKLKSVTGQRNLDSLNRTANGQNVGQSTNSNSNNQQWRINYTSDGYLKLVNRANGLAVDTGGLNYNGALMQMWTLSSNFNQFWTMVPQN
ncbi:RICIN domain-containing protein [Paenibacillus glycanilyticus]|uniref:Sugar-binding protein n=1 Tax=Paenibacillus glycanilyticus TaxID=126569 RepID=A0ABQ6GBU6_9BACL|nr:RICIN domain-containing protein [Paenibacillus glycanilyticus]GLX68431.1 sugar-binding protein [Paenibacillus glycanilyticus]